MMITFPKLLLLAVVAFLVWTFLKKQNIIGGSRGGGAQPRTPRNEKAEGTIEDMVKCPKCGSYVPAKGGHDCPGS